MICSNGLAFEHPKNEVRVFNDRSTDRLSAACRSVNCRKSASDVDHSNRTATESMEADMATAWQTVEEAALTLGISSRTLHRRIARNELETRLENGRREVQVNLPDAPSPTPSATADAASFEISHSIPSENNATDMSDAVGQTMLALHEDRIRRTDLAIMAYQQSITQAAREVRRTRVGSRWAWATASAAIITLCLGATWATHRLDRTQAQVDMLNYSLQQLSTQANVKSMEADKLATEADKLRSDVENARVTAAKVEGELMATQSQLNAVRTAPQQPLPMIKLADPMKLVTDK
jgi:hypothetical protein